LGFGSQPPSNASANSDAARPRLLTIEKAKGT
jgi:hypothetical protein